MPPRELSVLVAVMMLLGLAIWGTAAKWSARVVGGLGLLVALVGGFYLYIALAPTSPTNVAVAVFLFVGSAALFRLLSTFEQ